MTETPEEQLKHMQECISERYSTDHRPETPMQRFLRESAIDMQRLQEHWVSFPVPDTQPADITVQKDIAYIAVPSEILMDEGLIPDTRPPHPKTTWRPRFYWWRQRTREHLAYWLFEKLAGYPVPDPEDD